MTKLDDTTLVLNRSFNVPLDKLYAAWVNADQFCKWMGPRDDMTCNVSSFDVTPGGQYSFSIVSADGSSHSAHGVFREVEANSKLVFTWTWDHVVPERETLVTVEFRGDGEACSLTMTHAYHTNQDSRDNHEDGWRGSLDKLAALLASN